jgi:SAM-dependent methyltransferase
MLIVVSVVFPQTIHAAGDVPYVPTPDAVVEKMLDMADVKSSDYVIDLGSGDGRIVISAAQRGAAGHGIDIDPERVKEARKNAREAGVDNRVVFKRGDIFKTEFSEASVVTMYLLPSVNRKLRPMLLAQLEPGTRIVSHDFAIQGWKADSHVTMKGKPLSKPHEVYYWVVPAQVDGDWNFELDNKDFELNLKQDINRIDARLFEQGDTQYYTEETDLHGKRVRLRFSMENVEYLLNGRAEGNTIRGSAQIHREDGTKELVDWSATRN